ncbi:hypothetical protein TURU_066099 [Turdus rufiventris]|nr:hypothetical protein TURU_066099 [Turdus rufiventris]
MKQEPSEPYMKSNLITETISHSQPHIACTVEFNNKRIVLLGFIDTGANMTVISESKWSAEWTLEPATRNSSSLQSIPLIKLMGPENHITNTRPFVFPLNVKDTTFLVFHLVGFLYTVCSLSRMKAEMSRRADETLDPGVGPGVENSE